MEELFQLCSSSWHSPISYLAAKILMLTCLLIAVLLLLDLLNMSIIILLIQPLLFNQIFTTNSKRHIYKQQQLKQSETYNKFKYKNQKIKIMAQQQPVSQDINMQDILKLMCTIEGATQYVVTNPQGIPIKKSVNISAERALHISFLINDYWNTSRKIIQNDLKQTDNYVEEIRIRTNKQVQIIILQSLHGEATLYLTQNCQTKKTQSNQKKQDAK